MNERKVHHETALFREMDDILTWYAEKYACNRPQADQVLMNAVAKVISLDSKIKVIQ